MNLTSVERLRELKCTDKLRVEAGGDLNAHAAAKKPDVHQPQVWFLPPPHLVLLHHAGNDRVGCTILCFEDSHDGQVGAMKAA